MHTAVVRARRVCVYVCAYVNACAHAHVFSTMMLSSCSAAKGLGEYGDGGDRCSWGRGGYDWGQVYEAPSYAVLWHLEIDCPEALCRGEGAGGHKSGKLTHVVLHCCPALRVQSERECALSDFSAGRVKVLVATDVASRGLDIKGIGHVVNMDLPKTFEDYVHRIGRTGVCAGPAFSIGDARQPSEDLVQQKYKTLFNRHLFHKRCALSAPGRARGDLGPGISDWVG
eukprot:1162100-Pelagomonas_calceolata.AAC.1